ncbi:hypothetical protein [Streptomyces sp. KR80]|uniref:hypothetical protein n=1 Tax=Streptomyces sp. KR80 TaxID=3457426 RepID=UPI003FD25A6E
MSGDRATMPPVRLPSDAELARDALAAPLFARAVRLARWAGPDTPVGVGGELLDAGLRRAVAHLGLDDDEDGQESALQAWRFAVDTGLVDVDVDVDLDMVEDEADEAGVGPQDRAEEAPERGAQGLASGDAAGDAAVGTAAPGEESARVTTGSPRDVLEIWRAGLETVLDDAVAPDLADLAELVESLGGSGGEGVDVPDWDPEEDADFLDSVLGNLYLLTALDEGLAERAVPLPALAASVIVPDDMDEPTDDVLEEVSVAMMRLDDQFRLLATIGLVDYQPVDEALIDELDEESAEEPDASAGSDGAASDRAGLVPGEAVDEGDVSRYGMVRLTPLGVYGVRARMLEAGADAPAVGDLADKGADVLLDRLPGYPDGIAQAEAEQWLARHEPADAARELLAAARGDDPQAPRRRLSCQQALLLLGPEAGPALREVLDDPQLGGLARVGLAERGFTDVPPPSQDMIFWLTIDTIAAQVGYVDDTTELRELIEGVVGQHGGFFDAAWRVDHPATADVLEAIGRLHPDKKRAKEARKAAFKARSKPGACG